MPGSRPLTSAERRPGGRNTSVAGTEVYAVAVMLPRHRAFLAGAALAAGIVCGNTQIDSAGQATTSRSAALFTDAQARAGRTIYRQSCASCHGADLTGGSAPSLAGPRLAAAWGNPRSRSTICSSSLRTTMPPRASSTLSASDHAAVFAYILKANGFPSGCVAARGGIRGAEERAIPTSAQPTPARPPRRRSRRHSSRAPPAPHPRPADPIRRR